MADTIRVNPDSFGKFFGPDAPAGRLDRPTYLLQAGTYTTPADRLNHDAKGALIRSAGGKFICEPGVHFEIALHFEDGDWVWRGSPPTFGRRDHSTKRPLNAFGGRTRLHFQEGLTCLSTGRTAPAVLASQGARIELERMVSINQDLAASGGTTDNFGPLSAYEGGYVKFIGERENNELVIGNGRLDAQRGGTIELLCKAAAITCWSEHSGNQAMSINDGGRIFFRGTPVTLTMMANQGAVGFEVDGTCLAEGATLSIVNNSGQTISNAITLQKESNFYVGTIAFAGRGTFENSAVVHSGSRLVANSMTGDSGMVRQEQFGPFEGGGFIRIDDVPTPSMIPWMTTKERDSLTRTVNGMLIFNSTTQQFEAFRSKAWRTIKT